MKQFPKMRIAENVPSGGKRRNGPSACLGAFSTGLKQSFSERLELTGGSVLRYGNPSQLPSPMKKEYGAFAEHFVTSFAPEIFKTCLGQVELLVSGQAWLSKKCQYHIFQFFTEW